MYTYLSAHFVRVLMIELKQDFMKNYKLEKWTTHGKLLLNHILIQKLWQKVMKHKTLNINNII